MPADQKVSVGWQIVATFNITANLWAFYGIRKLRKYLLYVAMPSIVVSIWYISDIVLWLRPPAWATTSVPGDLLVDRADVWQSFSLTMIIANTILWGLQGVAVYLVLIWSREHNQEFDTQPNTT